MRVDQSITVQYVQHVELHEPKKMESGGWMRRLTVDTVTGRCLITLIGATPDDLRAIPVTLKGGDKTV